MSPRINYAYKMCWWNKDTTESNNQISMYPVKLFTKDEYFQYHSESMTSRKHRKNCECCPRHSLFKGHNVIVNIVVLNCQKCNQCLKCQVSGHKSLGLLLMSLYFPQIKRGSVTQPLKCCPVSLLIVRSKRLSWIQVLKFSSQNCTQCRWD